VVNQLSREIAEMPERVKLAARQGFEVALGLSDVDRQRAIDLMVASVARSSAGFDTEPLAIAITHLTPSDAGRLATALSIVIALLTENVASTAEFIQAARGHLFEPSSELAAHTVADLIISQRAEVTASMARKRLANVVLPSLTYFDVTVDVRLQFVNDKVDEYVPVAMMSIDTDGENNRLWCQLTLADVEMIVQRLQDAARQMALADTIMTQLKRQEGEK
jgi:hypothetical protein